MADSGEADISSVDLSLPDALSSDEKVQRLHEIGRQLVEITGAESGVTPSQESDSGQPVWAMWWGNNASADQ